MTKPPESIWVHIPIKKGRRLKMGTRVQVDFKTYVERVMINEWGPNETHRAQLLSAAQIVKQYAWWYITHPNKKLKDKNGDCFDVGSTTTFQLYRGNATTKAEASDAARVKKGLPVRLPLIRSAIEAIWPLTIWRTAGARKGDLFPEIATLRIWNTTDSVTGNPVVSAAMGSIERRNDAYLWRGDIWSVTDLAASGIDAAQMRVITADVNGDGSNDLVISAPTPASVIATGGGQSGIWVALSEKRNWVKKRIQDPVLGAPQLVGTSTAGLSEISLTVWDRNADGRDEVALFAPTVDGRLGLSLLSAPRTGGTPSISLWWSSDPLLGSYSAGSVSATVQPLGPQRDPADGRRALRSELIIEVSLGGQRRTLAISGAAPNSAAAR